jgi:hypothetical protein
MAGMLSTQARAVNFYLFGGLGKNSQFIESGKKRVLGKHRLRLQFAARVPTSHRPLPLFIQHPRADL